MTNEELVEQIQAGIDIQANMASLYEQNRRFIYKIALPFSYYVEIDDLMQEAYFGLVKAVNGYDKDKEVLFLTYAEYKIKAHIQRYCYNHSLTKRIPVYVLEQIHKYHKFKNDYMNEFGVYPSDYEIIEHLKITENKLKKLKQIINSEKCESVNAIIPGTNDVTLEETLADSYDLEEDISQRIAEENVNNSIWEAVKELDERSSEIIIGQYKDGLTQERISEMFEISHSRIGQIQNKALRELRKNILIQKAAEFYGYDSHSAFHYGLGRFKQTFTSSTEFLALQRININTEIARKHKCILK